MNHLEFSKGNCKCWGLEYTGKHWIGLIKISWGCFEVIYNINISMGNWRGDRVEGMKEKLGMGEGGGMGGNWGDMELLWVR
jgi:hypothetical protein